MSDIVSTRKLADLSAVRTQVTSAATAATGTVANLPAALGNATVGTLIKALVSSQTARGITTLQTDKGSLVLQTGVSLKPGSEIVLQLQSTGVQNRFLILSVDHQPLATSASRDGHVVPGQTGPAPRPDGTSAKRQPPANRPGGQGLSGHGEPAHKASPAGAGGVQAQGPQGSLSGMAVRGPLVPGLVVPARVTVAVPNVSLGAGETQGQLATSSATQTAPALPGSTLTLRILAVAANGSGSLPPSVPASSAPLAVAQGNIAGAPTPAGASPPATEIMLPEGRISLHLNPPPPPGSRVLFEILDVARFSALASPAPANSQQNFLRIANDWASLKETIAALQALPASGTGAAADLAAQPGPRMASTMVFFMSALKSGDLRAWLGNGQPEELARAGHSALLGQLADDFSSLGRHATEGQPNGWHALAVPVETGAHTDLARLYYRRRKSSENDGGSADTTHFVVEAEFSRLGLFRLEGLVRPRQFDLIVHSGQAMESVMRETIRAIFTEALTNGNLTGALRFEAGPITRFDPSGQSPGVSGHGAGLVV
jgi:hypothetical protein